MTKPAELYACLYAKEFSAQALLRLRPGLRYKACAVLDGNRPLQFVCSLNLRAHVSGAAHGMTRVELETLPSITVLTRSHKEELTTKTALLECAGAFSPRVEDLSSCNEFAAVIDISGTEKLFGPPERLARTLFQRVKALGITAVVTVSKNLHATVCLAKGSPVTSRVTVISTGQEQQTLAPLPISVLDLKEEHADTFRHWGIHTLGMLADLPEKELIARIGQQGKRLRLISKGELPHLFQPIEPILTLEEHMELDTSLEMLDSLLFVTNALLEQLIRRATSRVMALASVTITLFLEGGSSHTRTVRTALPTNDRQLWIKLLHLDLEAHPPHAAVLAFRLVAEPGHTSKLQLGLFNPQLPEPARLDVTLARIAKIVGEEHVGQAVLRDTHQHEGFRMERFILQGSGPTGVTSTRACTAVRELRPPENISLTLRSEMPYRFQFRKKHYAVERAYGPWRTSGDWWNSNRWDIEQWDLIARAQDRTLLSCCILRDLIRNRWQIVGLYD